MQFRLGGNEKVIVLSEARVEQIHRIARRVWDEPFARRSWSELLFFVLSSLLAVVGFAFIAFTMLSGVALAITFIGLVVIAGSLRGARGIGGFHRNLARSFLDEHIEEPEPFAARPGFFGWLQSALRDTVGWRAVAYSVVKIPLSAFGVWFAFSVWVDAFFCLVYPLWGHGATRPPEFGVFLNLFQPGYLSVGDSGFFHGLFIFVTGVILVFVAPWTMRAVVYVDRRLMRVLLAPDAMTARVRSLEHARAQTLDTSAATLRRIERDLHDGTQAQLVAVAMRLGQAKEKLAEEGGGLDLDQVRRLVDDAHRGAKEAIVELRDLARGIHPPALDIGLEGALSTLAARSTVPSEVTVVLTDRPTPAIEAIAYFCVAELMANIVQHAHASRASISCVQQGGWLRIVVRDDGQGGAQLALVGSACSGLSGLTDRVHAVDGRLHITSPAGGPTVITIDLPLHA
ncbi:MAG TPA: sensor domain-containing protein [Acidimicrobiales bacterium]|nr:sensor domain-containing protein [Acidimicrobiales bacterium]